MSYRVALGLLVVIPLTASPAQAQWLELEVPARPGADASLIEAGRGIYETHCWYCHGDEGDGLGPIAEYVWPRPRDFTIASFKLRTTPSGELPIDEDLFRSVSLGLPGTAMPAWRSVLTAEERWQVIAYLKTFSDGMFEDEMFDPYATVIDVRDPTAGLTQSLLEAGRAVFLDSDCWECHGDAGRGDGPKSSDLTDDAGYPILATDLELGWKFRGGSSAQDAYVRLTTGLDGSPMPSYAETLTEEERWQVAHYVASLERQSLDDSGRPVVITATRVDGPLPIDPNDAAWESSLAIWMPLTGQATFPPRWPYPSVTDVQVQAMYNIDEVALRIRWNDRTADTIPGDPLRETAEGWTADDTYPVIFPGGERERGTYPDILEVLFPASDRGPLLPHLVYGDPQRPVAVWRWTAETQASEPGDQVENLRAEGPLRPLTTGPDGIQVPTARAEWSEGRWTVVFKSSLSTASGLQPGGLVPIALHARDGGHGETGLRMSLSSWYFLHLKEPAGLAEALLVLLAILGTAAVEAIVVRVLRGHARAGRLESFGVSAAGRENLSHR